MLCKCERVLAVSLVPRGSVGSGEFSSSLLGRRSSTGCAGRAAGEELIELDRVGLTPTAFRFVAGSPRTRSDALRFSTIFARGP